MYSKFECGMVMVEAYSFPFVYVILQMYIWKDKLPFLTA